MDEETSFDEFISHCQYYISLLHLNDWDIVFENIDISGANANCSVEPGTRKATIRLATAFQTAKSIEYYALHECLEVLLGDMACHMRQASADFMVDDEVHRVINRLIPVVFRARDTKAVEGGKK